MMGVALIWIVFAVIVALIASNKGRSAGAWLIYGLLLWPVALIHVALASNLKDVQAQQRQAAEVAHSKTCPRCAETIKAAARVCRFCQYEFSEEELRETEDDMPMLPPGYQPKV
ncbi:hypothetical protein amb0463 [Paramagnetospirillum magneticum AMB-1]|uniref:Uncharacterized protein n=2 Tax=Paramagnetospirillum magneticum TaxID=84159 RepID=Q2WA58_PARM1|nr:hypothetical protein amb0463 [Paramagnetospirillum magneticum AMB-1]